MLASFADNETADENAFLDDFHFQDGLAEDAEISKRKLDSASLTFSKLNLFTSLSVSPKELTVHDGRFLSSLYITPGNTVSRFYSPMIMTSCLVMIA